MFFLFKTWCFQTNKQKFLMDEFENRTFFFVDLMPWAIYFLIENWTKILVQIEELCEAPETKANKQKNINFPMKCFVTLKTLYRASYIQHLMNRNRLNVCTWTNWHASIQKYNELTFASLNEFYSFFNHLFKAFKKTIVRKNDPEFALFSNKFKKKKQLIDNNSSHQLCDGMAHIKYSWYGL